MEIKTIVIVMCTLKTDPALMKCCHAELTYGQVPHLFADAAVFLLVHSLVEQNVGVPPSLLTSVRHSEMIKPVSFRLST